MSSPAIVDYLTKKLYIEKAIVTYRLLSREFRIHVNAAKNELAKFHVEAPHLPHPVESHATYLISGEYSSLSPPRGQDIEDEDENPYLYEEEDQGKKEGDDFEFGDSEEVAQFHMTLVGEANLEATKARFKKVHAVHVYCLTPSPLRDLRLICTTTDQVREIDNKQGIEMAKAVGKIIGPPLEYISETFKTVSISSKPMFNSAAKKEEVKPKVPQAAVQEKQQEKPKGAGKAPAIGKATEKSKPAAKHDFFKVKPKEEKQEEKPKIETKDRSAKTKMFFNVAKQEDEQNATAAGSLRGTKRKSLAPSVKSETEDDVPSTPAARSKPDVKSKEPAKEPGKTAFAPTKKAGARVQRGIVLSDEEDAPRIPRRKKILTKPSEVDSEAENEARALMDIDDEHVTLVPRYGADVKNESIEDGVEEEPEMPSAKDGDEDIEMEDEEVPKPKPKRRKPRKVVPVGHNGLKKKRVMKSRTKIDEKGYMATEDYSSYESAEEGEEEIKATAAKNKGKGKAKTVVETDKEVNDSDASVAAGGAPKGGAKAEPTKAPKGKATGKKSKVGGQASLVSFFGPPKAKK